MWKLIYERKFFNLISDPKPQIIVTHKFTNRRVAVFVDEGKYDWEQMAWLIPFMNTPHGRFNGQWLRLWRGTQMFTLPKEDLIGGLLEIKPRSFIDKLHVRVYESFLNDELKIS
ncbi:MAG TPA: hypothetical protein VK203_28430 [Nostocaceae cyanobacterium]|nr:hypothetical protein [Nostocaceae cyanobacterium]